MKASEFFGDSRWTTTCKLALVFVASVLLVSPTHAVVNGQVTDIALQTEFQEDLNLRQNEELGNLQRTLLVQVQGYAKDQGYDLIVGDGVLFASTAVNITAEVLAAIEANYTAASNP